MQHPLYRISRTQAALALSLLLAAFAAPASAGPIIQRYAAASSRSAEVFTAPAGTSLLIQGYNLGSSGSVAFRGVPAVPVSWSREEIQVTVPTAPDYPFKGGVAVTVNGETGYGPEFTITAPPPAPPSPPAPPPIGTWSVLSPPQKAGEVIAPQALAADTAGNLYVADASNGGRVQMRDAQGNWSAIAEVGTGVGQVTELSALAVDAAGNLYAADGSSGNGGRVQMRDVQGNWSPIATSGTAVGQVTEPRALAVDAAGNLYVADAPDPDLIGRIQMRDVQGNWSLIAAQGAALGQVTSPTALAVDAAGSLYVADAGNDDGQDNYGRIQKRDAKGNWSVIAGVGKAVGQVYYPEALAVDAAGNLYVAEYSRWEFSNFERLQQRDAQGNWSVIAGEDSPMDEYYGAQALAADTAGNLYLANSEYEIISKRDARGNWSEIATSGDALGAGYTPAGVALDGAGNLYIADYYYYPGRIVRRDPQGNWSLLATAGTAPGRFTYLRAFAVDSVGNLYVGDYDNYYPSAVNQIVERDVRGNWSVIAWPGWALGQVNEARGLAVDSAGNLYVADNFNNRIQRRDTRGIWRDVAFGGTVPGQFRYPTGLAVDAVGNLYVIDGVENAFRIQKRDPQGNWSVIATAGTAPGQVENPFALAADAAGNLYVAEGGTIEYSTVTSYGNNRIQKRDAQGNWSVIAGVGKAAGQVNYPSGLAVDAAGTLYVTDSGNHRVQKYTPSPGQ